MKSGTGLSLRLIRDLLCKPKDSCLTYAPWRGPFGVHVSTQKGGTLQRWGHNPIKWISFYNKAMSRADIKAAFLYLRISKDRPAFVLSWFIKTPERTHHVTGNAQP